MCFAQSALVKLAEFDSYDVVRNSDEDLREVRTRKWAKTAAACPLPAIRTISDKTPKYIA
jgi:hypothetical protein